VGAVPGIKRPLIGAAVALCFAAPGAYANPTGATVVNGSASFASSGAKLTVTNTPGAIINWQQFSIGQNEVTRFIQQNAASAVLNRVIGGNPSAILGTLTSNGRVFLINASGITIGRGAMIDVAGFAASTLNLSNGDFIAGRNLFQGTGSEGHLLNAGTIRTAEGGHVYLVAPKVENQKDAVITSPKGEILVAAGRTVELVNARTPDVRVEFTAPGEAVNAGEIVAASGHVGIFGMLVKNSGLVSASRAVAGEGGKIVFQSAGDVLLEAGSRVEAVGDKGGSVQVLGERVGVLDGASIDVSGDAGGGTVLVGGDFQGRNVEVQNAWRTYFGAGASIKADAIASGDGGKVIVWADDITRAYGEISARGGAAGGDGGFVEVSGKNLLDFDARVNVGAALGKAGTLLLDPQDIVIANNSGPENVEIADGAILFGDATGTFTLTDEALEAQLGNIVLQATQDITVNPGLSGGLDLVNQGPGERVTMQAGRHITIGSALTTAGAEIVLEADSVHSSSSAGNGSGTLTINAEIISNGGKITLIGGGNPINPLPGSGLTPGGIALSEGQVIDAGAGGIDVALSGNADLGVGTIGLLTQILGNPIDELHTTGALRIGTATTAGSDGLGTGAQTILADSVTNIYPGSAIDLSPESGTSFEIYAGTGGIVIDQPLTTFQNTVINTTGTLTINDPINTTNNDLQIFAVNVNTGTNGSINTGTGACTGTGCPASAVFWDGGAGTLNWFDAANWSNDTLPTASDVVNIDSSTGTILIGASGALAKSLIANRPMEISSTGALTLTEASQFADLFTLSGGSLLGTGNASVTGPGGVLVWSGGTMAGAGSFQLVSGRSGTLSNSLVLNRDFLNEGLLTLSSATISGTGSFANAGTLTAAAATTSSIANAFQNIANTIAGTLQVNGALTLSSFSANDGTIQVASAGSFSTGGTSLTNLSTGVIVSDGAFSVGTATFDNSGAATFNGAATVGTLTLTAGTVDGTGDLTVGTDYIEAGGALGTTFSDLSITKSGAFAVNGFTAVDSLKIIASGAVTLNGAVTTTTGGGDSVVIRGTSFTNNAGASAIDPGAGRFLVYSTNPASDNRGGLAYDFKQYDASFGDTVLGTGDGFLYTAAPTIAGSLTGTVSKVYDATTGATLAGANYSFTGEIDGDTVTLNNPGSGTYDNKNVGTSKSVSVSGIAITGATDGSATVYGYQLASSSASGNVGEITPASLTGSITASDKVYDATTAATISGRSLSGVLLADDVSYSGGTATFDTKNVGTGKTVTGTGLLLAGADAGNYTVNATAATTADVTQATLTGSITASDKVYDATAAATISGRSLSGVLLTDDVSYTGGTATFDTKNVGTGKTVNGSGLVLAGADAGNYTVNSAAATTADVTPASLTGSITASDKVYDATTTATISGRSLSGVLPTDDVSYAGGTADFDTRHAGTGKTVTANGLGLAGADAGNYTVNASATAAADVTPAALTLAAVTDSKTYDGTTASAGTPTAGGLFSPDSVSGLAQSFDSQNAGARTLAVNGSYVLNDGNGGNNYQVTLATAAGTIDPAMLTYAAAAASRTADEPNPAFTGQVTGFVTGENLGNATTGPLLWTSPADASSSAGSYAIDGSGLTALNGNYTFQQAVGNATALTIIAAALPPNLNPTAPTTPTVPEGSSGPQGGIDQTLLNLNTGENVFVPTNGIPDPGIYLSQDANSVVVVGESDLGSQLNIASTLLFPVVSPQEGTYVNSENGLLYAVDEGALLDPGVYYNREEQTVLVVTSNDDGNVSVASADIKDAVQTVASGAGGRRVVSVACR
jgi:filamentous hemagglutinin family protein